MWLEGNFVYLGIVIIVNTKILTSTSNHTIYSLFFQVGSIVFFMLSSWAMSYISLSVLYGTITPTMGSLEYYYILLLMLLAIVQVDIGVNYVNRQIRKRMIHYARKIKARISKMRTRKSVDSQAKPRKMKSFHTGFAFSQEPGSAPQIIGAVRKGSLSNSNRTSMMPGKNFSLLLNSGGKHGTTKTVYKKGKKSELSKSIGDKCDTIKEESTL
jgi:uncharacterized membrane protein YcgQ (UPF0703/DUF1980 family)